MAGKKKEFNIASLLNTKSRGTSQTDETTQTTDNAFNIVMIDVEDLIPDKDNFYSTENIDELAVAIELSGCIEQNLVVKPEAHGKYEIIAGHRRRLAVLKLVQEGKEEYRKVPCHIKRESDKIIDKLILILTNSTARQLTDWEKIRQVEELKEVLTEYAKALQEENKGKPKEEQKRIGRIREIIAQMLNTSTTQVGRIEAISNNLSQDFKTELEKGNINISTAHEISKLDEDSQAVIYKKYEEKGSLTIKDVREKQNEETARAISEPKVTELKQKAAESKKKEEENKPLPKQQNINDYPEDIPEPHQKGLDFTTWIREKYGKTQHTMIQNEIRAVVALVPEIEDKLTNALSVWVMDKTKEYQRYLQN